MDVCGKEEVEYFQFEAQWRLQRIEIEEEMKAMQQILSLSDLRPGQESNWSRIVRKHIFPLTVENKRVLVLLLCRMEKHPEATAVAVKYLHSSSEFVLAPFLYCLESWAEERKLSEHSRTQSQKLLEPLTEMAQPTCIVKPFRH